MGSDIVYTLRALRHAPWYSATVIGVIGVTLALATTVFAVVDGVLFRPLPYPHADRLVTVEPVFLHVPRPAATNGDVPTYSASFLDLSNWAAAVPDAQISGFRVQPWSGVGSGINDSVAGVASVRPNFFDAVGVPPLIGGFSNDDYNSTAKTLPVILMYETWRTRFGLAPDVVGRVVNHDPDTGFGLRIVGVMPQGFSFPSVRWTVALIKPYVIEPAEAGHPGNRGFSDTIARMPPAMSASVFAERLGVGTAATAAAFPPQGPRPEGWSENGWRRQGPYDGVEITPLRRTLGRKSGGMFLAVFAAVALLVLIAAANVSSLMTSRALERARELDMRRALGAGPGAIARLWALEAGILLAVGAAIGVAAGAPFLQLMLALLPEEIVLLKPPRLDWRVAGFVLSVTATLCGLVAVAPIRRSLRGAAKSGGTDRVRTPGRFMIVGGQVAAAFVLTVVGACLVGSLLSVYATDRPIKTDEVAVIEGWLRGPGGGMGASPERQPRVEPIMEAVTHAPGVRGATVIAAQLLRGDGWGAAFRAPDRKYLQKDSEMWAVMPGFYDVIGLVAIEGRVHTDAELRSRAPVVVISERLARAYWPNGPAVGQTLIHAPMLRSPYADVPFTVIGVVREVPWYGWDRESPIVYTPYGFGLSPLLTMLIRTDGQPGRAIDASIRAINQADARVKVEKALPLSEMFRESISLRRFQSWLFGGFAAAALAVVGVGILGLLAMSTARRTKEIGIRCALGSTPRDVTRLLVGEQLIAVVAGLVVGAAVAAWAVRFVKGYVYQLSVADARIWGAAIALIVVTAGIGALVPAWRASRIDPVKALRVE